MSPGSKETNWYEQRLIKIIDLIWQEVERDVLPLLSGDYPVKFTDAKKGDKKGDTPAEAIPPLNRALEAMQKIIVKFSTGAILESYNKIAAVAVTAITGKASKDFSKAMNDAMGVNVEPMFKTLSFNLEDVGKPGITVGVEGVIAENMKLIKTIPQTYLGPMQNTLEDALYNSWTAEETAKIILSDYKSKIKKKYDNVDGAYIAKRIARDQSAKIYSQTTNQRQKDSGIEYFKWQTTGDSRVSGNPNGLYPKASVKCYDIAREDVGMGIGVYSTKDGASWKGETDLFPGAAHIQCRCVSIPLIDGVNYDADKKKVLMPTMPPETQKETKEAEAKKKK